jgi:dihydropteroate synthase
MPPPLTIRGKTFDWGSRTYIMGILNLTPDSFSGDGLAASGDPLEAALEQARRFETAGADFLDIGGESTRPGSTPIAAGEEIARILPVLQALRSRTDAVLSIDTYKSEVAQAGLEAGADIVNDVWGLRADPQMASLVARYQAPIVLMHNRSTPADAELRERLGGRYVGVRYADLIEDISAELMESVALARSAGIPKERIILDPGIGFGKTTAQNLALLNRLEELSHLDFPLLIGPSRKSFIGYTLDLPVEDRLEGTAAAVAAGILRGAHIVRVHDVEFMARVVRMVDAIRLA